MDCTSARKERDHKQNLEKSEGPGKENSEMGHANLRQHPMNRHRPCQRERTTASLQITPALQTVKRNEGKSDYRRKYRDRQRPIDVLP